MDFTTTDWLLAALAALCVGLAKSGFAGFGMVSILAVAAIFPAMESTGALLPLLIVGDICAVAAFRRHAQWRHVLRLLPPTAVGVVLGYLLMRSVESGMFRPAMGWIILLMVALQTVRVVRPDALQTVPHSRGFAWFIGIFAGASTMIANAAGPVMTLYLVAVRLPKLQFVGTSAWFFLIVNVSKLPFSHHLGLIGADSLRLDAIVAPAVVLGILVGRIAIHHISQRLFEALILAFAAFAAVRLIWF